MKYNFLKRVTSLQHFMMYSALIVLMKHVDSR